MIRLLLLAVFTISSLSGCSSGVIKVKTKDNGEVSVSTTSSCFMCSSQFLVVVEENH